MKDLLNKSMIKQTPHSRRKPIRHCLETVLNSFNTLLSNPMFTRVHERRMVVIPKDKSGGRGEKSLKGEG